MVGRTDGPLSDFSRFMAHIIIITRCRSGRWWAATTRTAASSGSTSSASASPRRCVRSSFIGCMGCGCMGWLVDGLFFLTYLSPIHPNSLHSTAAGRHRVVLPRVRRAEGAAPAPGCRGGGGGIRSSRSSSSSWGGGGGGGQWGGGGCGGSLVVIAVSG